MGQVLLHTKSKTTRTGAASSCGRAALAALAYFDIFHYPLTAQEIHRYMDTVVAADELEQTLASLQRSGLIYLHHGFYAVQDNPLLAHRRRQGNKQAELLLKKADRIGRFLGRFPFVRAIGISGSLSKNYADAQADIDFFIITSSNRLWIARSLMHLYKKWASLFGKQHFYCMNYYIDEKALLLDDQNVFTAIEIKTLLPVRGEKTMQEFFQANHWAHQYLPCCPFREQAKPDPKQRWLQRMFEYCFAGIWGDWIENQLYRVTRLRWKRKEEKGKRNKKGLPMELLTGKHFAKSNPGAFQEKVLAAFSKRLETLT